MATKLNEVREIESGWMTRWVLLATVVLILLAAGEAAGDVPETPTIQNTTGNFWVNHTWNVDTGRVWYLISGWDEGIVGFNWTGSAWQSDSEIVGGIGSIGYYLTPSAFLKDGTWYLMIGESDGVFYGYNWTGSAWQSDSEIVGDLGDVGWYSAPSVFQKDGTWYLISGEDDGVFNGFNWTGSTWQSDSEIRGGLGDIGRYSAPSVFQKDGTWYLIAGERYGFCYGYNWTGSAWQSDSEIVGGLEYVCDYSKPTIFQKDGTWYLILGDGDGYFTGYNWTGSAWQSDSEIVGGLGYVGGDEAAPTVLDMAGGGSTVYPYNVSVNSVWYNGTTNTAHNDTYTPHAWQNITVFTYNSSGAGNLSESASQNTQIPNNPIIITNTADWSGDTGENICVDYDATDMDGDTQTFSCSRTDLFTDFHTATGTGNWIAPPGSHTYYVDFGVSDGWGSISNYTMTIIVNDPYPSRYIILYDSSGNLIQHAQVTIQNTNTNEITYRWTGVEGGIIDMGSMAGTFQVAVRTFDGVFVHTCDLETTLLCEITIPIRYNLKVYPVDEQKNPLTNVFAKLSEYTPISPQAFEGYSRGSSQYVHLIDCSGFAMCNIIVEKGGYEGYNVTALNWTSRNTLVKDYRHTATLIKQ
jgi:hypothetical protein